MSLATLVGENEVIKKATTAKGKTNDGDLTEETEGTPATAKEVNAVIGQTVEYEISTKASEDIKKAIGDWRVFYASNDEMFLISSNTIASTTAFGSESRNTIKTKRFRRKLYWSNRCI